MLRGLVVVVVIVGLVAALVFGPRFLRTDRASGTAKVEADAALCDLDVEPCRWGSGNAAWSLKLRRTGSESIDPLQFVLLAPVQDVDDARMVAVLEGKSMYMGQYPVALQREAAGGGQVRFHAEFQAPLCTADPDMVWSITLKQGGNTVDTPVTPTFQSRHPEAR